MLLLTVQTEQQYLHTADKTALKSLQVEPNTKKNISKMLRQ